jgi:chitinase
MYYGDWSIWGGQNNFYPRGIPADQLTHLNFAFLDFDASGNLIFTDRDAAIGNPVGTPGATWGGLNAGVLVAFQDLRAQNPNLRIGISVGGWSKSNEFSPVAANPVIRAKFIDNLCKFVRYTNMDFVDLDWEYPGAVRQPDKVDNKNDEGTLLSTPQDKENFVTLLRELRAALDRQGVELDKTYELSVALPATPAQLDTGIDIPRVFEIVDFANIMTYDLSGAWNEKAGHQTALYTNPYDPYASSGLSVDDAVTYLLSEGAVADKIVIGCAFYSRGWEKVTDDGGVTGLPGLFGSAAIAGADADQTPSRGATNQAPIVLGDGGRRTGIWSYGQLDQLRQKYPGLVEYWDDYAKAPYFYNASTGAFFTFENARSLREKAKYVLDNNLGGTITWMQSNDKDTGTGKRDELTKVLKQALFGTGGLPTYNISDAAIDVSASITTYTDFSNGGYEITLVNNATRSETGDVLLSLEAQAETVKLPKVYIRTASGATFTTGGYGSGTVTNANGYAIADLSVVYANQNIKQGAAVTFRVKPTGTVDVSDIVSIDISQRISSNGPEISRQTIYGGSAGPINRPPVISGVANKSIMVGDSFNPLSGVSASDTEDGAITNITVSGAVNTNVAGRYTLTYTVRDSGGLTATKSCVIEVVAPVNKLPVISGVSNKTINVGDPFDPLSGVGASDAEDGNISSAITVTGMVNTNVAGNYTITYAVRDSAGAAVTKSCVITVIDPYVNTAPVISGVSNKTINVGDQFDALTGVSASDAEEGNITALITVSGTVNTAVAGDYTLRYTVTDNGGLTASVTRVVTVKAVEEDDDDDDDDDDDGSSYEATKIYVTGDTVTYNGETYRAKWWIVGGGTPDQNPAWEKITQNDTSIPEYSISKEYVAGDKVTYGGNVYQAQWWTKGNLPGTNSVWKLLP